MRVVILQPGYLPWLGFFDQFRQSDIFIFYDDVQFDRRSWRNRNRIKSHAGIQWLTVPVLKKGRYTQAIRETQIDNTQPWQRKHLGSIRASYARAPYFDCYYPDIEAVISKPWAFLVDVDMAVIHLVLGWLGLARETRFSSDLCIDGHKTQRLYEICHAFGATEYLSPNAAYAYLDESVFHLNGVRLRYHNYAHPIYRQQFGPFVSHLSVIDLLFNHGPESLSILSTQSTGCPFEFNLDVTKEVHHEEHEDHEGGP